MKNEKEEEIWQFLHTHLTSIFTQDAETYKATTSEELSLYEWFVTPHRQDGLDFHFFMIDHAWAGNRRFPLRSAGAALAAVWRYGRGQLQPNAYQGISGGKLTHRTHNESRVLVKGDEGWQVVHVHKSPAWQASYGPKRSQIPAQFRRLVTLPDRLTPLPD